MKTCLITTAQPVDYSRFCHREAATLAAHGLDVVLIGLPPTCLTAAFPGVKLLPVAISGGLRKAGRLRPVRELAERERADVYHCLDPLALRVGLEIRRRRREVNVVYDSTELFPDFYRDRTDLAWPVRLLASSAVRKLERRAVREAAAIIETNRTRAERFRRMGREPVLVQNYPPRPTRPLPERTTGSGPFPGAAERIAWTGLVSYQRGFKVLLEAFADIAAAFPAARLTVFGRFDPTSDIETRSRDFISARELDRRVEFRGWLPYPELLAELELCHVGVILLQPGRRNDYTGQPNKLFEFMGAGLPVVASGFPEIAPVLERAGCGIPVDPTSPGEVADALRTLLADPDRADRLGRQGRAAVEREYNWDSAAARLLALYDRLAAGASPADAGGESAG